MHTITKTNLMFLVAMTLSIGSVVAMEQESEAIRYSLYNMNYYTRTLSGEIDSLLKNYDVKKLYEDIGTEANARTENYHIDDENILPLLKKPCNRRQQHTVEYNVSQGKSFTIETEHCKPSECFFKIKKGVTQIVFKPTPDKELLIISHVRGNIFNEKIVTELGYDELNKKVLAELRHNFNKKDFAKLGHTILNANVLKKLGYDNWGNKVLAKLQIIYPHRLMTIENQLHNKVFLNVVDPSNLSNLSPYAFVDKNTTKDFLISEKEMAHQTITFPGASDTVKLPIEATKTRFIITHDPNSKDFFMTDALIINAASKFNDSGEVIGSLTGLTNEK